MQCARSGGKVKDSSSLLLTADFLGRTTVSIASSCVRLDWEAGRDMDKLEVRSSEKQFMALFN